MISRITKAAQVALLVTISVWLTSGVFGQSKSGEPDYINTPKALSDNAKASFLNAIHNGEKSLMDVIKGPKVDRPWSVYSDRANNKLRSSPAGLENGQTLKFTQHVIVKDIKRSDGHTWLHVYDRLYKKAEGAIQKHKEMGWVRSDKVLLTNYAVLNQKSITKKRIALYSLDVGKDPESVDYLYYHKPSARSQSKGIAQKFRIFYVLKEKGPYVLLSKTDKLDGEGIKGDVLGWMKNKKTTAWNTRVCMEPVSGKRENVTFNQLKEYSEYELPVFASKSSLKRFLKTNKAAKASYFQTFSVEKDRLAPNIMRMPVLENLERFSENAKKVVTIANIGDEDRKQLAEVQKKLTRIKNRKEAVNILFIVDGTESMTEYYKPIRKSIVQTIKNNPFSATEKKLRFGLAIYRDYPDGDQQFKITPLTNDEDKVIKELRKVETKSKDDDLPEAQYQGIVKALNQAGFNKDNSNVAVLVGDAGNHQPVKKDFTKKQVINELYKRRASLIAFQVVNGSHTTYDVFNFNVQDFLRETANNYVENPNDVELEETSLKNTYKLSYPRFSRKERSLFMFGRFTYASSDEKAMDPGLLEKNIIRGIQEYLNIVGDAITMVQRAKEGGQQKGGNNDEQMITWMKNNEDFDQEDIQTWKQIGQFTKRGYVATKYYGLNNPSFKPVVFLSKTEKRAFDNTIRSLIRGRFSATERQKRLQDALVQQCMQMLDDSRSNVLNKTMDRIWRDILAIPFTGKKFIAERKLREIKTMSEQKFKKFYDDFEKAGKRFINKSYRNSRFELADQYYYWIPLNEIPGNVK
jgi:hypothetical protein